MTNHEAAFQALNDVFVVTDDLRYDNPLRLLPTLAVVASLLPDIGLCPAWVAESAAAAPERAGYSEDLLTGWDAAPTCRAV
jgi:hypothetical protein